MYLRYRFQPLVSLQAHVEASAASEEAAVSGALGGESDNLCAAHAFNQVLSYVLTYCRSQADFIRDALKAKFATNACYSPVVTSP